MTLTPVLCADHSRAVQETLKATAPRADVWLLLEYDGPWAAKALPASDLDAPIKSHLQAALDTIPATRFQFIRQPSRQAAGLAFFVVDARRAKIYAWALNRYQDLLDLNLNAIAAGKLPADATIRHDPLYLVCTNGKRDASCARYGVAVYEAMQAVAGTEVWQCTHIGGHRFAATSVFLPHGLVYGRITVDSVASLIESYRNGQLVVEGWRGRCIYPEPVQAAEAFVLAHTGWRDLNALRLIESLDKDTDEWLVEFAAPGEGKHFRVNIVRRLSDYRVFMSTGDEQPEPVPVYNVRLVDER